MTPRQPLARYEDPLDRVWIATAARIGFRVQRTDTVYASADGAGTLAIGTPAALDPDDCLAQMIFHELCHSLVEGPAALDAIDWGLCNQTDRDVVREHACLRVQAALAAPLGLRAFLAPTTEYRAYYDNLPADPLLCADRAAEIARAAIGRVDDAPWSPHLRDALAATAAIARVAAPFRADASGGRLPSLFDLVGDDAR